MLKAQYLDKKVEIIPNIETQIKDSIQSLTQQNIASFLLGNINRPITPKPKEPQYRIEKELIGYKLNWYNINKYLHEINFYD